MELWLRSFEQMCEVVDPGIRDGDTAVRLRGQRLGKQVFCSRRRSLVFVIVVRLVSVFVRSFSVKLL